MTNILVGSGADVITLLLFFITLLLTKRIIPSAEHEKVVAELEETREKLLVANQKLKEYEEAAPQLILEVRRLVQNLDEERANGLRLAEKVKAPLPTTPSVRPRRIKRLAGRIGNDT